MPGFGLSHALWNSRYWLLGINALFLVTFVAALPATFLLLAVLVGHGLTNLEVTLRDTVFETMRYWYIPLILLALFLLVAYGLSLQAPEELSDADPAAAPREIQIQKRLESLCIAGGLPLPQLYVVRHASINALIWGGQIDRRLYITEGARDRLTDEETDALMAQALGHYAKGDNHIYPMMSFFVFMGCQVALYYPVLLMWFWLAFNFYGRQYGRTRHFAADLFAIRLSKNALALMQVIEKTKDQTHMHVIPDEWRSLAFVNPDPAVTLPWYMDSDDRLACLREVLGQSEFMGKAA